MPKTQYTAYVVRTHRFLKETRSDIEMPQQELLEVPLEFNYDLEDPESLTAFIETAMKESERIAPVDEHWEPTRYFRGARETRPTLPAPKLQTPLDSPAALLALASAREYPTLFGNDEFSVLRVWENWFFTIGTGWEWQPDGTLASSYPDKSGFIGSENSLSARLVHAKEILARPISPDEVEAAQRSRLKTTSPVPDRPVSLYPLSRNYSSVFSVPEKVEASFYSAAVDLCLYFLRQPVWMCWSYHPAHQEPNLFAKGDLAWRTYLLVEGATQRTRISDAYGDLVLKHYGLAKSCGFGDERFNLDTSLPPQWISSPVSAASLALAKKLMAELMAETE